ncbi:MAG: transcription termination factor NusA [bacterium]|jgi:N utilization substance protein A
MDISFEIVQALKSIARAKEVDESLIIETLQAGLISAARKKFGPESRITVDIDEELSKLTVYCTKDVVEEVEDKQFHITLEDAREIDPDAQLGKELKFEIPLAAFGRNAIQAMKQVVTQRVREAERDRVYQEYAERIGEVVGGGVQQVDRGNLIVNLGRTEALLPQREQIPREQFRQGSSIRAYIIDVTRSSKGPQVILSRAHRDFLKELFAMEVPEINDGTVEIMGVAREPGARSKIAVHSHDDKVDAVGACVGMKGSRVQTVVRELNGERIDVVLWSDDIITYVIRSLSPAKVVHAEMDEKDDKVTVIVADDQLSLAIGKGGQNARLAAKLTNLKIDLINESQYAERVEFQKMARFPVSEIPGISAKLVEEIAGAGYKTADDLSRASILDLMELDGIGEKTAEKVIGAAKAKIEDLRQEFLAARQEAEARAEAERLAEEEAQAEAERAAQEEEELAEAEELDEGEVPAEEEEPEAEESGEPPEDEEEASRVEAADDETAEAGADETAEAEEEAVAEAANDEDAPPEDETEASVDQEEKA